MDNQNIVPKLIVNTLGNVENAKTLLTKKQLQIGLTVGECVTLKGKSSIVLDFGKELNAGIRILTYKVIGDDKVRIRFGESYSEANSNLGEKGSCNDHSPRDFIATLSTLSDLTFGSSGFRFVRIDTLSDETVLMLKSIVAKSFADERELDGEFLSSDELVNEIFNTASYTLRLCLNNGYFWDGVKRDRLVWIGDLYPEMRSANALFRNTPETFNSLMFAKNETPIGKYVNNFPAYSLWWLIIFTEEYFRTGKKQIVLDNLKYIDSTLDLIISDIAEDGEVKFYSKFIDWQTHYVEGDDLIKKNDEDAGIQYLMIICLNTIKKLYLEFDLDYSKIDVALKKVNKKQVSVKKFKQISALGVFAGDLSDNNKKILKNNAGLSTFMAYHVLTALAKIGEHEFALDLLKKYYGGMLSVGATTFFEDFDLAWLENAGRIDGPIENGKKDIHGDCGAFCYKGFRHSLCHGWSAGVLAYLSETVLGVKQIFEKPNMYEISPNLSYLDFVKGKYPTCYGDIVVEHKKVQGKVVTKYSCPKEISVIINN